MASGVLDRLRRSGVSVCSSSAKHAVSKSNASNTPRSDVSWLRMHAKVSKLPHYRHSKALKTCTSGSEIKDAFNWMRSWTISLPAWPATNAMTTKNGMISNRKGEMLPIDFFIFFTFARFYNRTDSKCTVQRNRFPLFEKKLLDQRSDFVDQPDCGIRLPE